MSWIWTVLTVVEVVWVVGLASWIVLERRSPGVWTYYSLSRTSPEANPLARGHAASYLNRAVALFRSVAGIPTDQEPPAARSG